MTLEQAKAIAAQADRARRRADRGRRADFAEESTRSRRARREPRHAERDGPIEDVADDEPSEAADARRRRTRERRWPRRREAAGAAGADAADAVGEGREGGRRQRRHRAADGEPGEAGTSRRERRAPTSRWRIRRRRHAGRARARKPHAERRRARTATASRRRRRRGRRGGRRNRRDRDGEPLGDGNGDLAATRESRATTTSRTATSAPDWAPPRRGAAVRRDRTGSTPPEPRRARPEPAAAAGRVPPPSPPPLAAGAEPRRPRRRSTVREPAPVVQRRAAPTPAAAARRRRAAQPVVTAARADDAEQAAPHRLVGASACSAATQEPTPMQSRWVDRDAQARSTRYAAAGIAPDLALRVYTTRLLGRDPKLVLHGGGNTSVKTRAARSARRRRSTCSASRAPAGTWATIEPAGLPAVRLDAAAQAARARRRSPTRTWCASSAPTCSIRWRPIRRSRRCCTPSCRTNSSTTPTPPRCSAWSTSRTAKRSAREVYGDAHGLRALHHAGLRARQGRGRRVRRRPEGRRPDPAQARHLHLRRRRARSLRAHDRDGHARRGAAAAQDRKPVFVSARTAAADRAASPTSRRSCAAPCSLPDDEDRRRVAAADPRFPHQRRDPAISSTARTSRATPGRRRHARPHHPHQELAADRAGAGRRQARRLPRRPRAPPRQPSSSDYHAYFARNNARVGGTKTMLDPLPRVVLVPGLGLFGLGRSKKDARDRRRSRRGRDRGDHRRRSDRPLRVDLRSRHVRLRILVARTGQARQRRRTPLAGQIAVDHRRGRRHRRRDREGVRRGRRRGRAARHRRARPRRQAQGDRRRGARGRAAT